MLTARARTWVSRDGDESQEMERGLKHCRWRNYGSNVQADQENPLHTTRKNTARPTRRRPMTVSTSYSVSTTCTGLSAGPIDSRCAVLLYSATNSLSVKLSGVFRKRLCRGSGHQSLSTPAVGAPPH